MSTGDQRADAWLAGYRDALTEPAPTLRATFAPFLRSAPIRPLDVPADQAAARRALLDHLVPYAGYNVDVTVSADLRHGSVWVGNHGADQGWTITLEPVAT